MASIKQLPPKLDVEYVAGRPFAIDVTCTGATITSPVVTVKTAAGDDYTANPPDVSVAGGVVSIEWSAADTAGQNATTRPRSYLYELSALVDGEGPFPLMAGTAIVRPIGSSGTSSSSAASLTFTAGITAVNLTVTLGGGAGGGDVATHIADPTAAHAASAISYAGGTGMSATDVEAAIDELATEKADVSALASYLTTASAAATYAPLAQAVNAQTGTTYTLVAADAGRLVTLSNASAVTLTVPQDSDATIAVGTYVDLYQLGAGQVTVVAGTGATLRVSGLTSKARAQYSRLGVQKVSANTWSLFGDLAAS